MVDEGNQEKGEMQIYIKLVEQRLTGHSNKAGKTNEQKIAEQVPDASAGGSDKTVPKRKKGRSKMNN